MGQILRVAFALFHNAGSLIASIPEEILFVGVYIYSSVVREFVLPYLRDSNRNLFRGSGKLSVLGNNARVIPP